jgi:hypothetical protein
VAYAYQEGVTYTANGLAQVLAETLEDDKEYTLTVEVGNSWTYYWPGYSVQLLAGGTVIAEDYNTVWPNYYKWETSTVKYTYDVGDSGLVGQPLEIRLLNLGINTDGTALDNYFEVEFDDVKLNAIFDMNPSPYDGQSVTPPFGEGATGDEVILSWTNMDPNTPGDDVYVDVWFGIDPNSNKPAIWGQVVETAENVNSVTVVAPIIEDPATYYWRVDSYIYGSTTGDPIEGPIYTFYTTSDIPPVVDAGKNMITWSGEPVQLDATVEDDGVSPLNYAWNSVPADGVGGIGVSFNPNEFVEDPEVTISKIPDVAPITIINPGFEDPALADGDWTYRPKEWKEGWYDLEADPTRWTGYSWSAGSYDPNATYHGFDGIAPEGENVAFVTSYPACDMGLRQTLSTTLQPETQYELSALVGNPVIYNGGTTTDYRIELVAGDVVIATATGPSPVDDTYWTRASLTFTPDENHAQLGEPLEIRLIAVDIDDYYEVDFDDVQLVASGEGAPGATVKLTVAVNDEFNTKPAKDSMKINVYDDACEAARDGVGLAADNIGDINGDCITNLEDLTEMVSTWLNDTGLMEPLVTAPPASAGNISYFPITGDRDSGISADNTYTHAIDFGSQPVDGDVATVNGVIFADGGPGGFPAIGGSSQTVGTGTSSIPTSHDGDAAADEYLDEGGMRDLVHDMIYNDGTAVIQLTGLTPGAPYQFRLYHRSWGGTRSQDIGFDTDGIGMDITGAEDTAVFYEDDATQPDPSFATATQVYALTYDYRLSPGVATLTVYINQTGTGTYHLYGLTNQAFNPMEPSPRDSETVSAGLVELSWTNLDPNSPDPNNPTPVWVDVWFGTDPNDLTGVDYKKVVDAGENVTSVQVDAPVIGETYYWQVDSYLNGSPTGDPNVGELWVFYAADLPPFVDAGDDMITWSGEPLQLDGTVEDDGHSTLEYIFWSAEPVDGTEVVFDPVTADVEDPDVTITAVPYSEAKIANASFEDPVLADDDWDWSLGNQGWGYFANAGNLGPWNPTTDDFPDEAPEGDNVGWTNPGGLGVPGGFAQVLTETITADTTYTLTVEVGRSSYYSWGGYKVQLLAGGTPHNTTSTDYTSAVVGGDLLAEDDNSLTIAEDTFETSTVVHTSGGPSDPTVGQPLQIRLLCRGNVSGDDEAYFDNVRLIADPPFFPAWAQTVKLTLSAGDAVGSREDTMEIDLYNNNCLAAKGSGLAEIDPGDFDADCDTDIEDFVVIAEDWLIDYELTEPIEKP